MKRVLIFTSLFILIIGCSFLSGSLPGAGPDVNAQKSTQEALLHQQETQNALIQTQVAQALNQNQAAQPSSSPQVQPQSNQPPSSAEQSAEEQTRIAEKTEMVAKMLTSAPQETATPDLGGPESDVSPMPKVNPKASDGSDFTDAVFYAWGQWDPKTYGITIQLKGTVGTGGGKNFIMKVDGTPLSKCYTPLDYPNRIQCTGVPFQGGKKVIEIYENVNGTEVLVYATKFSFPGWTSTVTKAPRRVSKTPEE